MAILDKSTSDTSGSSYNITGGDKYSKKMLALLYAAGGLNKKKAKKKAKLETKLAGLDPDSKQFAKISEKLAQIGDPSTGGEWGLSGMPELEYYPDPTYVDMDPFTQMATAGRAGTALGHGMSGAAQGYVGDVLGGKFLTPDANPYLKDMYDAAAGNLTSHYQTTVVPGLEARFAKAGGRSGAAMGAHDIAAGNLAGGLSDLAANLYGGAYGMERGLQQQAAQFAPQAQQMGYYDLDELERAGRTKEAFEKTKLQDLMSRFYFRQDEPFARVARITGGAVNLPMAAGAGETDYGQRTFGTAPYHEPKDTGPSTWERAVMGLI
jgi:hypothetical protein